MNKLVSAIILLLTISLLPDNVVSFTSSLVTSPRALMKDSPFKFNKPMPFYHQYSFDSTSINFFKYQRSSSRSTVTCMGLFGLGGAEIAIILVAAAFLLGPDKLVEIGKDAGKVAAELKEVPAEFQKGFEEGETNAKAKSAKVMKKPIEEIKAGED